MPSKVLRKLRAAENGAKRITLDRMLADTVAFTKHKAAVSISIGAELKRGVLLCGLHACLLAQPAAMTVRMLAS